MPRSAVFADWATGVCNSLDPQVMKKHVTAMVEVSRLNLHRNVTLQSNPDLICRQYLNITIMIKMVLFQKLNSKRSPEIFPS